MTMEGKDDSTPRGRRRAPELGLPVLVLFFFSGATSLVYQVLWTRMFGLVLGSTVTAVAAVLASFLGGLTLGSFIAGRLAGRWSNLLRIYAVLEVAIGILAGVTPVALGLVDRTYASLFHQLAAQPTLLAAAGGALTFLVLLLPTACMGASFPFLTRFVARRARSLGRRVGILYGLNTVGAAGGAAGAGLFLIAYWGVHTSLYLTALVNLVIGLAALLLSQLPAREVPLPPAPPPVPIGAPPDAASVAYGEGVVRRVLLVLAFSGFAALAYEVLWTRLLVFVLDSTTYAFSMMLVVTLLGIGVGSVIFGFVADRWPRCLVHLGILQGAIGLAVLGTLGLLAQWGSIGPTLARLAGTGTLWRWNLQRLLASAVFLGIPALLLGGAFPLATRIVTRSVGRVGASVGTLYAANTLGGVAGALLVGLLMLPALGWERSILLVALVNVLLAMLLLMTASELGRTARLAWSLGFLLVFLIGRGLLPEGTVPATVSSREAGSRLVYRHDGPTGTVTVHDYSAFRTMAVNGVPVAGTDLVLGTTQLLQGHLPCLLHARPRKALHLGFGSGETSRVALLHGVETLDGVEIARELVPGISHFIETGTALFTDPRFRAHYTDGRSFTRLTREKYDVILNDPGHPAFGASASLYTREHFRACRERLAADGLFSTWIPFYGIRPAELAILLRTFQEVFPHGTLWVANNCPNRHGLLIARASDEPFSIDWSHLVRVLSDPAIAQDLAQINLGDVYALLDCLMLDEQGIAQLAAGPVHSDDRPTLEFGAPRALPRDIEPWVTNLANVTSRRASAFPLVRNFAESGADSAAAGEVMARYFAGTSQVWRGLLAEIRGIAAEAENAYRTALEINPDDRDAAFLLQARVSQEVQLVQEVAQRPEDPQSRLRLARLYLREGKPREALAEFAKLTPNEIQDASIWYDIGVCHWRLGALAEAEQAYRRAIQLSPALAEPHVNLGVLYQRQGRYEEAMQEYRAALKTDPLHPEANYNMGVAYAQRGLHQDAIPYFEKAISRRPTYADAYYNLGISCATVGDLPRAVEAWKTTLSLNPQNEAARANLARALTVLGQGAAPPPKQP